jgi:lysophospholipase L1-like esterase
MLLKENDHILFYGDSITDAGRRDPDNNNGGLGFGYVALCAAALAERFPQWHIRCTNRGVSGNRVGDLEARLERDVLALEPTVVSILIGINDTWRRYDSDMVSGLDEFRAACGRVLAAVRDRLGARVILLEPFLLPIPDDRRAWREDLDPRIAITRDLAREYAACFVPLDGLFAAASCRAPMAEWLPDGVHPTPAGHQLIARHWLEAVTS